jgi:hypothetical protein
MLLAGVGLSGSGLATGLVAWKPVLVGLSVVSLATSHFFVWRRGWGGATTKTVLILSTLLSILLWTGLFERVLPWVHLPH